MTVPPIHLTSSSRRYVSFFRDYYYRVSASTLASTSTPMPAQRDYLPLLGMFFCCFVLFCCLLTIITSAPHAHPSCTHHVAQPSVCPHTLAQRGNVAPPLFIFRYVFFLHFSFFSLISYSYMSTTHSPAHTTTPAPMQLHAQMNECKT